MCGIFAFVSKKPKSPELVLNRLKTLEYRGYDSWGVAIKSEEIKAKRQKSEILVEKHVGKIGNAALNSRLSNQYTTIGIGHTRWATHGGVTAQNAHPHLDCNKEIAIIHNGIVENNEELKEQLLKKGHTFLSQTDTEVIVHLIEENLKENDFNTAACKTFLQLEGLNAFIALKKDEEKVIAAKKGSPLIIGFSTDTYYITSDVSALPQEITEVIVLQDNQVALIDKSVWVYKPQTMQTVNTVTEKIDRTTTNDSKGKYPHFLIKEINEQPEIIRSLYSHEINSIKRLGTDIYNAFGTFTLGCGTASYAAMAGEYFLSKIAKKHINFSVGSEFKYLQDYITKKSLIIPVSQSGETIDVVEPVQKAKSKGARIISIVNVPHSTLARLSDYNLLLHAGTEKAVVGTKSFTAMIGLLLLTAFSIAGKTGLAEDLLNKTAHDLESILSKKSVIKIKALSKKLKSKNNAFTIGRGISYVTALEGALKLKETSLVHAEGFAGGELKHGVIALVEKGTPCFVFAPNDETYQEIVSNAQEIKARGGYIIGIGPKKNSVFDEFLQTADLSEATLIPQVVYMQLLAYYLALERGIIDPDKPRNLAKSVTVK